MLKDPIAIFTIITAIGLAVMILGFRLVPKTRKTVETAGAIVFHIGVLGILYYKVALFLFVSLAALVISLFLLFDPLKISQYVNAKFYRLTGYFFLAVAVVFSLAHLTGFPPGLWMIPLLVYLLPYLVPSLKKNLKIILAIAWIIILAYLGVIGYIVYGRYYPINNTLIDTLINPRPPSEPLEPDDIEDLHLPLNPTVHTIDPQQPIVTSPKQNIAPLDDFDGDIKPKLPTIAPVQPPATILPPVGQPLVPVAPPVQTPTPITTTPPNTTDVQPLDDNAKLKQEYETLKHLYEQLAAENKELKDKLNTE
jgi:hypothetical protein